MKRRGFLAAVIGLIAAPFVRARETWTIPKKWISLTWLAIPAQPAKCCVCGEGPATQVADHYEHLPVFADGEFYESGYCANYRSLCAKHRESSRNFALPDDFRQAWMDRVRKDGGYVLTKPDQPT